MYNKSQAIFANITGIGGAIATIRISGEARILQNTLNALDARHAVSGRKLSIIETSDANLLLAQGESVFALKANCVVYAKIYDRNDGIPTELDECLITHFCAPNSFTGEAVLEVSIHGSSYVLEKTLAILSSIDGARHAEAGEFSYRAFLNGKIDLVQAESINSLIASKTQMQHKLAMGGLLGKYSAVFAQWRDSTIECLAYIESLIDFSDEELPSGIENTLLAKIETLKSDIIYHLEKDVLMKITDGVKIVLFGKPNAGKSSIFNAILNENCAIVSQIAGTTRDVIEKQITLSGIPCTLYDTAGLREAGDEIEIEGIRRAKVKIDESDIKIHIIDASDSENWQHLRATTELKKADIIIINKSDIAGPDTIRALKSNLDNTLGTNRQSQTLTVSAHNKADISTIHRQLEHILQERFTNNATDNVILNVRHKTALENALFALKRFNLKDIELAAEDLRITTSALSAIIGTICVEDILGEVFSKFCIGK